MRVYALPNVFFQSLGLVTDSRPAALITTRQAWSAARPTLNLSFVIQAEPTTNDKAFVEGLANDLPSLAEVIYVVGDGLIVDVGRYVAYTRHLPLVIVPTSITTDEPFLSTTTLREGDRVLEIATQAAREVIVDLDLIRRAPAHLRSAAIVDVIAIYSALLDWNYAASKGMDTDARAETWVTGIGAMIAGQALKIAPAVGKGETDALRALVNLICLMVQIDNQLGHRRMSQGIEHIFAEALETQGLVSDVSHAEKVAVGILLTAALHNKETPGLRSALEATGVRLGLVRETWLSLPEYARQHNSSYTMLNDLKAQGVELAEAVTRSSLF
jgi:glycerol-1-phosphate dehydrogenase [NAD(P)+]